MIYSLFQDLIVSPLSVMTVNERMLLYHQILSHPYRASWMYCFNRVITFLLQALVSDWYLVSADTQSLGIGDRCWEGKKGTGTFLMLRSSSVNCVLTFQCCICILGRDSRNSETVNVDYCQVKSTCSIKTCVSLCVYSCVIWTTVSVGSFWTYLLSWLFLILSPYV